MWRMLVILGVLGATMPGARGRAGELWKTPTSGDVWDLAPADDLDGDGKKDLLAGAADNTVRALSGLGGKVIWSAPAGGDVWCVSPFPDLDGDGKGEAAAGTGGNEVLVISSSGKLLWSYGTGGDAWCLAEAGDSTGDGVPELACGAGDNQVHLLDLKERKLLWTQDLAGDVWSVAGGKDLSGDGVPDVVAGTGSDRIAALSGKNGALLWQYNTVGDVWRVLIAGDLDQDSVPDVVAGTGGNRVLCISGKPPGQGVPRLLWQSHAGSDIRVLVPAPDYDRDGLGEILAGGLDNVLRLLRGSSGEEVWAVTADGAIKDALIAPDLDGDGAADVFYSTDGSTVNAVSGANKASLWTHAAEADAIFWSLAPLPDLDGDGIPDLAAGSSLNEIIGLPAVPRVLPDPVNDLACVAAQAAGGPGALLTWTDAPLTASVRVFEVAGAANTLLGEVPAGVQRLLTAISGSADPRDFSVIAVGRGGESSPEGCTATMAPPPVASLTCSADLSGAAAASWALPDPGLRQLDGVRVALDGAALGLLPAGTTSLALGKLAPGIHTVVVTTVWGPWDSPTETCKLEVRLPAGTAFVRGDANGDSKYDISDPITVLLHLFLGEKVPCRAALDGNGEGGADISDAVYLLMHLFLNGSPPPPPFPECGVVEGAECASFPACLP